MSGSRLHRRWASSIHHGASSIRRDEAEKNGGKLPERIGQLVLFVLIGLQG